jgi:hypothetical protein
MIYTDSGPILESELEWDRPLSIAGMDRCHQCYRVLLGAEESVCQVCIDAEWAAYRAEEKAAEFEWFLGLYYACPACLGWGHAYTRIIHGLPAEGSD